MSTCCVERMQKILAILLQKKTLKMCIKFETLGKKCFSLNTHVNVLAL